MHMACAQPEMSTIRVVMEKFTEVFEGQFVDRVRFESDSQKFDLLLMEDRWVVSAVDWPPPKIPDHVNPRHSGSIDIGPAKPTEDISVG